MAQLFFGRLAEPKDVIQLLAGKSKHWQPKHSAYEAAHCWFAAKGLPPAIRLILESHPTFLGATLLAAFFELQTALGSRGRASQTDVLSLLRINSGLAVVGVECKARESFGQRVSEWEGNSAGKRERLEKLVQQLALDTTEIGNLRYQLLHRAAATLLEAKRFGAQEAALIVHYFRPDAIPRRTSRVPSFSDFQDFARSLKVDVTEPGRLSQAIIRDGIKLRLGWAESGFHSRSQALLKTESTKIIHEGGYAAEVPVVWIDEDGYGPCLSLEDVKKLEEVRDALREGDLARASKRARLFH